MCSSFVFDQFYLLISRLFDFILQTRSQLIKTSLKLSLEMKRKTSTTDSSSIDMPMCKKIKEDIDTSDDDDDDETSEHEMRPTRSSNPLVSFKSQAFHQSSET